MSLNKLQNNFSAHILNIKKTDILKTLPYSKQEALERLNIYRNNVLGNFSSVLGAIFPVIKNIVGEKKFKNLVDKYQEKYPSKSGNLDDYGDKFPKLLENISSAFLPDLARLELAHYISYFAENIKDFEVEKFKKLNPDSFTKICLELHPSCSLIKSKFPIFTIWDSAGKKIPANKKDDFILVDRADGACNVRILSPIEFSLLKNISQKKTLYQSYQNVVKIVGKEFDVGKILTKFVANRVISGFYRK